MHELTALLRADMKPAFGVTEPGAIAFAVATARRHAKGKIERIRLSLSSGMYKNGYTCGIPGTTELGNDYAAALGATGADPERKLLCLDAVTPAAEDEARALLAAGKVEVVMHEITSRIFIEATVKAETGEATVTIRDAHTNIVQIAVDGETVFAAEERREAGEETPPLITRYTLAALADYAKTVPVEEIAFIREAFEINFALAELGVKSDRTTFSPPLLAANRGEMLSADGQKTARLLACAAIEARVLGLPAPAMSITGSGAHGILATMPLYAAAHAEQADEETLLRATALSFLVCIYIKEYSGKLSAFCGCAIAAGAGAAVALSFLRGGSLEEMTHALQNVASSITGMICDGGNHGCTMKAAVAVDTVWISAEMARAGAYISDRHGINARTPETTMQNIGRIAAPGMTGTEKTIIDILEEKTAGAQAR